MSDTSQRPRQREPLGRDRILTEAIALADRDGVDSLSMRKLAKHLGYEAMSLYNHVADKDDLLDGMVDLVAAEIAEPPDDLTWKPAVRSIAISAHDALARHRWAVGLWSTRWPGPNRWHHMEVLLRRLATAGFPAEVVDLGFRAVTLHIEGFTRQQITSNAPTADEAAWFERFDTEVSADVFPHVVAHVRYHRETADRPDGFGFVLDLILDELERIGASTNPTDVGRDGN